MSSVPAATTRVGVLMMVSTVGSEFGPTTVGVEEGSPIYAKVAAVEEMKKMGVDVLRVFCGIFADWVKMCIK